MDTRAASRPPVLADAVYGLLNPIPFGCFVAALIFDIVYVRSAVMLWDKAAAWLIVIGLFAAIIPRLLNLVQVWLVPGARRGARIDFWLNVLAVIAAIFNAFVHSRDAYAVVPAGVWLSAATVALMAIGNIVVAVQHGASAEVAHG